MRKEFLYHEIANRFALQIKTGVLMPGDRLPSVRVLCKEQGIGVNTAKRVFLELEAQSLIDSKPQSGYFVSHQPFINLPLPEISQPALVAKDDEPNELIDKVYRSIGNSALTLFSIGAASEELLPLAKLKKEIVQATRALDGGGTAYEQLEGNVKLRRMVAQRSMGWGGNLHENDLITTSGGMDALSFCLMAMGKPGDTVAIESPCYPGILQLAISLGLKVLELPTDPITGIDIDALESMIERIDICLLIPNFNTPLGSCMPDQHKERVVALLSAHQVPLIEDDVYGDLYFGGQRPKCCKSFDKDGNVLWCSSVSKTLAPGFRVGWVAPGRYKEKLLKLKLVHSISSTSIVHEAVGNFMKTGRYESHLRQLRKTLWTNVQHYTRAIAEYFPEGTKISRPQGGLVLWLELPKNMDTAVLYDLAMKQQISFGPGRMFTLQDQFSNCMRLCIGLPWSEKIRSKLQTIGALVEALQGNVYG